MYERKNNKKSQYNRFCLFNIYLTCSNNKIKWNLTHNRVVTYNDNIIKYQCHCIVISNFQKKKCYNRCYAVHHVHRHIWLYSTFFFMLMLKVIELPIDTTWKHTKSLWSIGPSQDVDFTYTIFHSLVFRMTLKVKEVFLLNIITFKYD